MKFFRQTCIYICNNLGSWESLNLQWLGCSLQNQRIEFWFPAWLGDVFSFLNCPEYLWTPTASIHCTLGVLLLGVVKWLGYEADHPTSSSAGTENRGLCLQCMHRDNFLSFTYHSWLSFLFIRHTAAEKNDGGWMVWAQMWATTKRTVQWFFHKIWKKMHL